ncbi:GNAT family N-acetyltransferase [Sphingobacterium spiritivorum]|uniref:GNAT family N-acetyltransferase n=1 Tax=Sphingobacterium spiritivorum TaxID=258 RepID=UPI001918DA02|nr:GNAT family N-acetyltransferase [Sphingobacterium spiritivorum]QQT25150.1 N-acetyltransferase [Sphingobacterium spiritivorum]
MQFKHAILSDLIRIVEIYNSTVASRVVTADTEPVSTNSRIPWFEKHDPEKRPLWVLENEEGFIIGWISFQSFYGRPAYQATVEISIYLDEAYRGQGLGKLAIDYAIQQAPAYGIKTLLGFIFAHNTASLRLFEHFGFEEWAMLPDIAELDGIERSLKILGKKI